MAKNEQQGSQQGDQQLAKWVKPSPRQYLVNERKFLSEMIEPTGEQYRPFELSALMLLEDTPSLQACLQTRAGAVSLRNAIMRAAATGLSLNPALGMATIIPYSGEAHYQVMKNGLIELAIRSGSVAFLTSDIVRDKDEFVVTKSLDGDRYTHTPNTRERGEVIGYYAAAKLKDGATHVRYMTKTEAIEHRDRYAASVKAGSMWSASFDGAALKTVLKNLLRNLHLAPAARAAITIDDQDEAGALEMSPQLAAIHVKGTSAAEVEKEITARTSTEARDDDGVENPEGFEQGDLL